MHSGQKSNKCNKCDFASFYWASLRKYLKTHGENIVEKNHKKQPMQLCSLSYRPFDDEFEKTQWRKIELVCNYFSSQVCSLRTHLKIHIGKKSNNCNQCDYSSFLKEDLRKHLKTFRGEMLKNAPTLTIYPLRHVIWGYIWKHTVEKS